MSDKAVAEYQGYIPSQKEQKALREMEEHMSTCRQVRQKKYRFLGDRRPQQYWDEQEKRFVTYAPPKDLTEDDWQANVVMGITRNAVLSLVAKAGMRVPEANIRAWGTEGFLDDERSRIYTNLYRWANRREFADRLQQYVSLGGFVRGNACLYEGFEDKEIKVDIVTDLDPETGEVKTESKKEHRWGPRRQIVPLDEIFYPSMFLNDIQDQPYVIWRRILDKKNAKAELGGYKNWKYVIAGMHSAAQEDEPFFRNKGQMTGKTIEVRREYGNPWRGGRDMMRISANGVLLYDGPLPFNHKKPPFIWGKNEPFSDMFMLGMGCPFKVMDNQDVADAVLNMSLDKNHLSLLKPVITDDPDPSVRTYLSPGSIMQVSKGAMYQPYPIEGVTPGEFNLFQETMRQAKEFTGAFGGGMAQSPKGGKVTARQAVMQEEATKQMLGISMANVEAIERDLAVQRICNIVQFAPGSGLRSDVMGARLSDGRVGRFIAQFPESDKAAEKMRPELSMMEQVGQLLNQPTEAVALKPKWFDLTDRLEAEVVPESSYLRSKSIEQAQEDEYFALMAQNPLIEQEELLRENLKVHGKDPEKLIRKQAPPMAPGMGAPGPAGPGQAGPITGELAGQGATKSLNALLQ